MFHPELQPEYAAKNLSPSTDFKPLTIHKRKPKPRFPQPLLATAVESGSEKRFVMPESVRPGVLRRVPALKEYTAPGYDERLDSFKDELNTKFKDMFLNEKDRPSTLVGEDGI